VCEPAQYTFRKAAAHLAVPDVPAVIGAPRDGHGEQIRLAGTLSLGIRAAGAREQQMREARVSVAVSVAAAIRYRNRVCLHLD
jgi:hypothetical protein